MSKKTLAKKRRRPSSSSSKALSKGVRQKRNVQDSDSRKPGRPVAARLPAVENKHTTEQGHAVTYELRPTLCGKPNCRRHHGPYWYAYWSQGGRVRSAYIGRVFQKVSDKCPEKFRPGERFTTKKEFRTPEPEDLPDDLDDFDQFGPQDRSYVRRGRKTRGAQKKTSR